MSKNANYCLFTGRATREPELRTFPSGSRVVKFSLAVNRRIGKDKDGKVREEVFYPDFEAWDAQADVIAKWLKKGDSMCVMSSARSDKWTDKDGNARSKVVFKVEDFSFTGGNKNENANVPENAENTENQLETVSSVQDNEVPF